MSIESGGIPKNTNESQFVKPATANPEKNNKIVIEEEPAVPGVEEARTANLDEVRQRLGMSPLLHAKEAALPEAAKMVLEKRLKGESLTTGESIRAGRDTVYTGNAIPGISIRPDYAYRAISKETLQKYVQHNSVEGELEKPDVFTPGEDNAGVDWYLGGVAPRYGNYILETPAQADYFTIADQERESLMARDPFVRHIKSEGGTEKSIPLSEVSVYELLKSEEGELSARALDLAKFESEK